MTGNFVIDPAWTEADFERLWAFVERHRLFQAGFTILTPLPGTAYFEQMRRTLRARRWSQFDMHHLLWEPALGPRRFFELYCETWRRSVLNLKGRKGSDAVDARGRPAQRVVPDPGVTAHAAPDGRRALPQEHDLSLKGTISRPNARSVRLQAEPFDPPRSVRSRRTVTPQIESTDIATESTEPQSRSARCTHATRRRRPAAPADHRSR